MSRKFTGDYSHPHVGRWNNLWLLRFIFWWHITTLCRWPDKLSCPFLVRLVRWNGCKHTTRVRKKDRDLCKPLVPWIKFYWKVGASFISISIVFQLRHDVQIINFPQQECILMLRQRFTASLTTLKCVRTDILTTGIRTSWPLESANHMHF